MTQIINGKEIAQNLQNSLKKEISYLKKVELNDTIFAECKQNQKDRRLFTVNLFNQRKEEIAIFKGIAHFTKKDWL